MRGVKWVLAIALGVLGAALGTVVGTGGSSKGGQATAASLSGDPTGKLDPVINDGTKAVLKAVDQGLSLVLGGKEGKGGSPSFKTQETGWNLVKNNYATGEREFVNTATKASNQFLKGVLSGGDPTADLIQLLKLISAYQQKVSSAGARWDQAPSKASFDLKVASASSATGAGGGKMSVSDLKGATQLIQTVAKAEITLYEKVAITEVEYQGGLLDPKAAIGQIDAAFAAFEAAITGGAKSVVKGAPVGWNTVVNKQVAPVVNTWNVAVNKTSTETIDSTPQPVTTTTVTTTTTTTLPNPTITIQCPAASQADDYGWIPPGTMTVSGSVSPAVSGAPVTIDYGSSLPGQSATHTVTTGAGGSFTDTFDIPTEQQSISIQASYGGANSNACSEEDYGG